jgi:hypothetical protein
LEDADDLVADLDAGFARLRRASPEAIPVEPQEDQPPAASPAG